MFTKYGYTTIGIVAIISFLLITISFFIQNNSAKIGIILMALIILILTLNFFLDPDRITPKRNNIIVSPADGKIVMIKDSINNKFVGENVKQISIFMSPMNVHVNRIPISGVVEYLNYYEGKFTAAFDDKASENNERMEIGIRNEKGKVMFTQIAGFLARRIVNELTVGDSVKIGERFGMIKFGSRVDVFVPSNWKTNIKMNQYVTAGETILFELTE